MGRRRRVRREGADSPLLIRLLPALLIVLGVTIQRATPPDITVAPFFAAAPMVAAPLLSARATALTGLAATLSLLVLVVWHEGAHPAESLTRVTTVATVSGLALYLNRVVRQSRRRLSSARGIAEAAQLAVLPRPPDRLGGLRIAARYEAAHADARIGGDLYAVQETPYGVRLLVGDVRGKGLGAVEAVAVAIGSFREVAEQERSLERVAARLDHALAREARRRSDAERLEGFTTAVLAEVSGIAGATRRTRLRLVNRGHPAPLLLLPDGTARPLKPSEPQLPLGLGDLDVRAAARDPAADETAFPSGATLLLYTDGLTEARDAEGAFYEPATRARVVGWSPGDPEDLLDALLADVATHTGGQPSDDMALLALYNPS